MKVRLALQIALLFLCVLNASELQSQQELASEYVQTTAYNVNDGLLISRIVDIVADESGFIWLTCSKGLQFWDGENFKTLTDTTLTKHNDWKIRSHPVNGIIAYNSYKIVHLTIDTNVPAILLEFENEASEYSFDLSLNELHIILRDSLYSYDQQQELQSVIAVTKNQSLGWGNSYSLSDRTDDLVITMQDKLFDDNHLNSLELLNKQISNTSFLHKAELFTAMKQALSIDGTTEIKYPQDNFGSYYSSICQISDNQLLVGLDKHLYVYNTESNSWDAEWKLQQGTPLLKSGFFDKMLQDKFGNIWAINVNEGLVRIHRQLGFRYFGSDDSSQNFVKNIAVDKAYNAVIVAGLGNGLIKYDTMGRNRTEISSGPMNNNIDNVLGVYSVGSGRFIYNVYDSNEISLLDITNQPFEITKIGEKKVNGGYYQFAVKLNEDEVLLSIEQLYHYKSSTNTLTVLADTDMETLDGLLTKEDLLLCGQNQILSVSLSDYSIEPYSLPSLGYVRSMIKDSGKLFFLATDAGLVRWNRVENSIEKLYDKAVIYSIERDERDNLWMGTDKGLVQYSSTGTITNYGPSDGIQDYEFNTNASAKSANGELYFGGLNGANSFYPTKIKSAENPVKPFIKEIIVNNEQYSGYSLDTVKRISLSHDQNSIVVKLSTLGQRVKGKIAYEYKLSSQNSAWINNGSQSSFNFNLSPGEHKVLFRLLKQNVASKAQILCIEFNISKPWYGSTLFYLLSIILVLGLFAGIIYFFNRQKLARERFSWEAKYKVQEERIRLSRNIHDQLGSQLSYLVNSIDNLDGSGSEKQLVEINRISNFSRTIINDLRSLIWVLNKESVEKEEIELKIFDLIRIVQENNPTIQVEFEVVGDKNEELVDAKIAGHIFRILQELMHNTIKHANAELIRIELVWRAKQIELNYQDNGIGMEGAKKGEGFGLKGIKSRLAEIGSELNYINIAESGINCQAIIPIGEK